jgi:hypothetical protein
MDEARFGHNELVQREGLGQVGVGESPQLVVNATESRLDGSNCGRGASDVLSLFFANRGDKPVRGLVRQAERSKGLGDLS